MIGGDRMGDQDREVVLFKIEILAGKILRSVILNRSLKNKKGPFCLSRHSLISRQ
ncbi:hypothetical protein HYC85_008648 [Camellia sinensis]|uniref:Uncharacterized protein n=1 Tax=Camellia sinensis TaxID=4442 RepID=A0A7J7HSF0_CAMSI|nr:hypothetical protein HYC85_008648 [Camellia sinensis]